MWQGATADCYVFDLGDWSPLATMAESREFHRAVQIDTQDFWILGRTFDLYYGYC